MKKISIVILTITLLIGSLSMAVNEAHAVVGKVISSVARKATIETIVWIGKDKAIETIKERATEEVAEEVKEQFVKKANFYLYKAPDRKVYNIKKYDSLTDGDNKAFQEALRKRIEQKMAVRDPLAESFVGEIVDFFTGYKAILIGTSLITGMLTQGAKDYLDDLVFDTMMDTGLAFPAITIPASTNNYTPINTPDTNWSYTPTDFTTTPNPYSDFINIGGGQTTVSNGVDYELTVGAVNDNLMNHELSLQTTGNFIPEIPNDFSFSHQGFNFRYELPIRRSENYISNFEMYHTIRNDGIRLSFNFTGSHDYLGDWIAYLNGQKFLSGGSTSGLMFTDPKIISLFKDLKVTKIHFDQKRQTIILSYTDFINELVFQFDVVNLPEIISIENVDIVIDPTETDRTWDMDTKHIVRIIDIAPLKIPYIPDPAPDDVPIQDSPYQNDKEITIPNITEFPVSDPTTGEDLQIVPDPITQDPIVIDPETGMPYPEDSPDPVVGTPTIPAPTAPTTPISDPVPDPAPPPEDTTTPTPTPTPGESCSVRDLDTKDIKKLGTSFTYAFPFSIPWDIYRALDSAFGGMSEDKPEWKFTIKNPVSGEAHDFPLGIPDFFDKWQPFFRNLILFSFDISMIYALRKWFGGQS